jgi:hypothetical protein
MLGKLLQEVLDLQPEWSHRNTPDMDRRGIIVRREIPTLVRDRLTWVTAGSIVSDLDWAVEGRDGTGPKTEIPWVRVYDRVLSPSATIGWYVVYLFSAFGDRLYLSLGHGSTEWTGTDFHPRPVKELHEMTDWARRIVSIDGHLPSDFVPDISLEARRSNLGAAYEAGTVLAKEYRSGQLPNEGVLWQDLTVLVSALSVLYDREATDPLMPGIDPPEVRELVAEIEEAAGRPPRKKSSTRNGGQGFGLSKPQKDAVEKRAVAMATSHYEIQGWSVKDVGATHSYDLHCRRDGEELIVEVKGTTSAGRSVILTANEVQVHREKFPHTALFVVSEIVLTGTKEQAEASGGRALELHPWTPSSHDLIPMAFKYVMPSEG